MAQIVFDNVSKLYADGLHAVRSLTLAIEDGEFLVLVGPSGCGKSTALRMVAGLEDISEGRILVGGAVANDLSPRERNIAMVFQSYALYPHLTVAENIGFGLRVRGVAKARGRRQGQGDGANPRTVGLSRPQAGAAFRRPAPARRDGPRHRARAERLSDGRAAVQSRCAPARPDARRDRAAFKK